MSSSPATRRVDSGSKERRSGALADSETAIGDGGTSEKEGKNHER
jgi:hypothetical protein